MTSCLRHTLMVSLLAAASTSALAQDAAQPAAERASARQQHQQQRIANGQASGKMTAQEAQHMEREQGHVAAKEQRYMADDGKLNKNEQAKLKAAQDKTSADIHGKNHNTKAQ